MSTIMLIAKILKEFWMGWWALLPWASWVSASDLFQPSLFPGTSWTAYNPETKRLMPGPAKPSKTLLQTYRQHPFWLLSAHAVVILIASLLRHGIFFESFPLPLATTFLSFRVKPLEELSILSPFIFFSFLNPFQPDYLSNLSPASLFSRLSRKPPLCQIQRSGLSPHLIWLTSVIWHSWPIPFP